MPKAYLIDPATKSVEPFDYAAGDGFPGMFKVGLCTGFIYPSGDVLYVDDEMLLRRAPACGGFVATSRADGQPLFDKGVLVGPEWETRDGWGCYDPRMSLADARAEFRFLDRAEALDWFRQRAGDVAVRASDGERTTFVSSWGMILRNLEGREEGYHPRQVFG